MNSNLTLAVWTLLAGAGIPLIGILNSGMAQKVGNPLGATAVMFAIAFLVALGLSLPFYGVTGYGRIGSAPLSSYGAGVLIGFYALSATIIIPPFRRRQLHRLHTRGPARDGCGHRPVRPLRHGAATGRSAQVGRLPAHPGRHRPDADRRERHPAEVDQPRHALLAAVTADRFGSPPMPWAVARPEAASDGMVFSPARGHLFPLARLGAAR